MKVIMRSLWTQSHPLTAPLRQFSLALPKDVSSYHVPRWKPGLDCGACSGNILVCCLLIGQFISCDLHVIIPTGKDLSRVSMPVTMNEPLSALQRLCEEMQYSSLLQEAAGLEDPYDRMVRVAAFAVSSYADTQHRAGSKPFNPILGETFECIREDKGFWFIAEQVSL